MGNALAGCGADCTGQAYMTRPGNFIGFLGVASGGSFNISAEEWNEFSEKIKAFALYKVQGLEISNIPPVINTQNFEASIFNATIANMDVLDSFISLTYPSMQVSGNNISASFFTSLKNALNSII